MTWLCCAQDESTFTPAAAPAAAAAGPQVPLLWNRSAEAAAAKVSAVATALGIDVPAAAGLYMAVPALASINMPGVVRDRVEALSDSLGVTCAQVGCAHAFAVCVCVGGGGEGGRGGCPVVCMC